jgi:DNA polymerase V
MRNLPLCQQPKTSNHATQQLMLATQNTRDIVAAAMRALNQIWRDGYQYQKASIVLNDFFSKSGQIDIFDLTPPWANSDALMRVSDGINLTGQGIDKGWRMKREIFCTAYTTRWKYVSTAIIG